MILFLLFVLAAASPKAALRMEKKLDRILQNSSAPEGRRGPRVVFTQEEIDSYFALSMGTRIPKGVSGIRFELHPGRQTAFGVVDFDQYKAAQKRPVHPILDLFVRGRRSVTAVASFECPSDGNGVYHLESVSLDDFTVRGVLLDFLIRWFVLPRYPKAAPDHPFPLPANVRKAVVEEGRVVVYP